MRLSCARAASAVRPRNSAERPHRLESVVRQHSPLPGRQTLFYISEGFPFDSQEGDINYNSSASRTPAARSGTVVYSLDARGLSTGMESVDASSGVTADPSFYGYIRSEN
jgi:hypothetical protein